MDNFGLPEQTVKIIINCFENVPELDAVKIFGSRAKGNFKPHSDIDFVLYGKSLTPQLVIKSSSPQPVLDLLHAHRVSPKGLCPNWLNLFAIRTCNFVAPSVRKFAARLAPRKPTR